jgi:hypothetical protein
MARKGEVARTPKVEFIFQFSDVFTAKDETHRSGMM